MNEDLKCAMERMCRRETDKQAVVAYELNKLVSL